MVAGAAWLGLLLRMLQQLFSYILWGCSGVWGSHSSSKGDICPSVTQNRTGFDMGTPSDTRTWVVAWQKWDFLCWAKPLVCVVAWEKDLMEGQVGNCPDHLQC